MNGRTRAALNRPTAVADEVPAAVLRLELQRQVIEEVERAQNHYRTIVATGDVMRLSGNGVIH
ncbi:MAG: hypothetical protein ACK4QP_14175 [Pseudorhizobium sp.]